MGNQEGEKKVMKYSILDLFIIGFWFAIIFWAFFEWDKRQEEKMKRNEINKFLGINRDYEGL